MSQIKLTADSGGGSVSLKAPATTTGNAALEFTVPDVATGSTVVTKTSANKVGLNVDPEVTLHVHTAHANSLIKASGTTSGSGINDGLDIGINGSNGILWNRENGELQLATNNTERLTVKSTGHVELVSGNLEFANGAGIDFSNKTGGAAGATSNQLSDYEEGTFTPGVTGTTGGGTPAYNGQSGYYIKIGKQVTCWVDLTVTSWSGASGDQQISGFPYTKSFETGYYYSGTTNWYVDTNMGGTAVYTGYFADGSSTLNMFNGSTWANIASCGINVTGRTSFMIIYTTS